MKKVKKITPIMDRRGALCDKCKFGGEDFCNADKCCSSCELYDGKYCVCTTVKAGQPCPYFERKTKVKKITPIKNEKTLCKKCKYGWNNHCAKKGVRCTECKMDRPKRCVCTTINDGQPCPYFERYVEEAQHVK